MPRGGKREGAGRPTAQARELKAKLSADATGKFQERATADLDLFYDAMRDIALGVWVADEEHGRVYQRPPDRQALQTLIEHSRGKPATTQTAVPDTNIVFLANVPRPGNPEKEVPEVEQEHTRQHN